MDIGKNLQQTSAEADSLPETKRHSTQLRLCSVPHGMEDKKNRSDQIWSLRWSECH